jgi:rod shape-determining protein MreD
VFDRVIVVVASRWFRLVLVSLLVLSLQTTLFSEVRPFGYAIQILAIFVACAGATHDVYTGAVAGLVSGFMYDAILATPLGISALVLGVVGAAASVMLQPFRDPTWWLRLLVVGVAAALGEVVTPLLKAVVGLDGWLEWRVLGAMFVTFGAACLFAAPMITLARWTLREKVIYGSR